MFCLHELPQIVFNAQDDRIIIQRTSLLCSALPIPQLLSCICPLVVLSLAPLNTVYYILFSSLFLLFSLSCLPLYIYKENRNYHFAVTYSLKINFRFVRICGYSVPPFLFVFTDRKLQTSPHPFSSWYNFHITIITGSKMLLRL